MCDTTVKIAVVGAGLQGSKQVHIFTHLANAEVVALADVDGEKANQVAQEFGVPRAYADYHEMLREVEADAVSVATPDHLHLEPCLAAIETGRHLLVEKPLATSVEEGEKIVQAAKAKGIKMMINFSNRFQVALQQTKEAFDKGELGRPVFSYARLNNTIYVPTGMLKPWSSSTKLPYWLMSHTVDRIRWLWGRPNAVRAYGVERSIVLKEMGYDTPDVYHGTVEFDNGAVATFESCWILPETSPMVVDSKMELIFSEATVTIDAQETTIRKATQDSFSFPATLTGTVAGRPVGFVAESLRHFVECIAEDRDPDASGDDALAVLKITDAIVESARIGQPVTL